MDISNNRDVKDALADIQREREINDSRHPHERKPVQGEVELLFFIGDYIERELKVFKSEGGDLESQDFFDWLNRRDPLDSEAIAELHEKVPGSNAWIVALSMVTQHAGCWLVAESVDPLVLRPKFSIS
jgi:hypothetical protein